MSYYFTKSLNTNFSAAKEKTIEALKKEGFGIITEIDMQATLKNKLNVDIYKYEILGACSPKFAHQAMLAEDKIGLMLPCNLILQQKTDNGPVEISAIDPVASMMAIKNDKLGELSSEVQRAMKRVIESI